MPIICTQGARTVRNSHDYGFAGQCSPNVSGGMERPMTHQLARRELMLFPGKSPEERQPPFGQMKLKSGTRLPQQEQKTSRMYAIPLLGENDQEHFDLQIQRVKLHSPVRRQIKPEKVVLQKPKGRRAKKPLARGPSPTNAFTELALSPAEGMRVGSKLREDRKIASAADGARLQPSKSPQPKQRRTHKIRHASRPPPEGEEAPERLKQKSRPVFMVQDFYEV